MEDGAKVKLRGVEIGEVESIDAESRAGGRDLSSLKLKINPDRFPVPAQQCRGRDQVEHRLRRQVCRAHRPLRRRQPETVSAGCRVAVAQRDRRGQHRVRKPGGGGPAIDPAKLNGVLSAVAEALRGKGDVSARQSPAPTMCCSPSTRGCRPSGRTASCSARPLQPIRMPRRTCCRSWTRSRPPAPRSPRTRRRSTNCCCRRSGSPERVSTRSAPNQPNLVRAVNTLAPTSELLQKYSPELHLPVPGRAVVPGPRWPRCAGRQR